MKREETVTTWWFTLRKNSDTINTRLNEGILKDVQSKQSIK